MATRAQVQVEVLRMRRIPGIVAKARCTDVATPVYELSVKDTRGNHEQQLATAIPGGSPGKWVAMTTVESAANVSVV